VANEQTVTGVNSQTVSDFNDQMVTGMNDQTLTGMKQTDGENLIQETILTCIGCPMGCLITVTRDQQQQLTITGEQCSRGKDYARTEMVRPTRTLTTLIAVPGSRTPLSVKTSQPVPREMINACLDAIHATRVQLPVERGAVLIENLLGTGSDVVATRTLKK